jgi:thiol-disulfide isomerase/thioredoxin
LGFLGFAMINSLRRALLAAALAVISTHSIAQVEPGSVPPDLLGTTYEGQDLLVSAYKGKVVVATFWASWCGPCQRELPLLEGLQKVVGPERVKVVAISIEDKARFNQLGKAAKSLALTFVHDATGAISRAYGVNGIPHLVIIGKDGRFQKKFVGYSEEQVNGVIAQVQAALQE